MKKYLNYRKIIDAIIIKHGRTQTEMDVCAIIYNYGTATMADLRHHEVLRNTSPRTVSRAVESLISAGVVVPDKTEYRWVYSLAEGVMV